MNNLETQPTLGTTHITTTNKTKPKLQRLATSTPLKTGDEQRACSLVSYASLTVFHIIKYRKFLSNIGAI